MIFLMQKPLTFLALLIVFFVTVSFSEAEEGVVRLEYECRDTLGTPRWEANTEITNKEGNLYVLVENVKGIYSSFDGPISWVAKMEFESTDDIVRPISLEKKIFDENGKMIRLEEQKFDYNKKIATCTHNDIPRNISKTKKFRFNNDIVNRQILGLYGQKLLKKGKTSRSVTMLSEEPGSYMIDIKVVDKETIVLNGCKREAYKISIDPRLGLLNVVKVFFPKTYAWHSAEPEFEWLKYSGLEGGVSSAKVEITRKN